MYRARIEHITEYNEDGKVLVDGWWFHVCTEDGGNIASYTGFNDFNHCRSEAEKEIRRLELSDIFSKRT